jgi:hypothetical protein
LVELAGAAQDADAIFAARYQWPMVALVKVVKWYERKILPKGTIHISDWERETLDVEQIECLSRCIP